jgi:hypothetical protein
VETTVEFVHLAILKDAAKIANEEYFAEFDPARPTSYRPGRFRAPPGERQGLVFGDIYRPDPVQSDKGGLALSIDPHVFSALDQEQQLRARTIARAALKRAIVENKTAFIGLILGEARQGRNYFERYGLEDQLRLL